MFKILKIVKITENKRILKRNLFKRRIRSLYDDCFIKQNQKITMIIIPKTINLSWLDIKNSFGQMLKKINDI